MEKGCVGLVSRLAGPGECVWYRSLQILQTASLMLECVCVVQLSRHPFFKIPRSQTSPARWGWWPSADTYRRFWDLECQLFGLRVLLE